MSAPQLRLYINTDNAAFDEAGGARYEAARILRALADKLERHGLPDTGEWLHDVNGNTTGRVWTSGGDR